MRGECVCEFVCMCGMVGLMKREKNHSVFQLLEDVHAEKPLFPFPAFFQSLRFII